MSQQRGDWRRADFLVVRTYALRGARLWIATRALTSALFFLGGSNPLRLVWATQAWLVVFSILICILETRRRREGALLANLAVSPLTLAVAFAAPASLGEILLGVIGAGIA